MPYIYKHRRPPEPWRQVRAKALHRALLPLYLANWLGEWAAYVLGGMSWFEVFEYMGSLSIVVAVIFYFYGAPDRLKQKHYQAWQVINTAQGKGGSGGRIDALGELNDDGVPLVGVDVSNAYLQEVRLPGADLRRCDMRGADLRHAVLRGANLEGSALHSANYRGADLSGANLTDAHLDDADLSDAMLQGADLHGVSLDEADLRGADLAGLRDWNAILSLKLANIHGVRNAPDGFVAWARNHGAVEVADDEEWDRQISAATRAADSK